ncbi:hypothetical protein BCV69DRAFT_299898 [Microstroma glucosiphilum]|uniref:Uncharacterized protein n=1 Tax=Pseudomicrostroma glucosiphilum TaxID=1684307 RepID=A0A316U5P6_9BASI|nr:hypothetical protein BCV69DRAFT_299898 [Pseudomicrostroma glucosiphilum]PWN20158.1 hypothetical protein BCV69DRAFT_299898 [Pseudomicrostroma glucosiphilum]
MRFASITLSVLATTLLCLLSASSANADMCAVKDANTGTYLGCPGGCDVDTMKFPACKLADGKIVKGQYRVRYDESDPVDSDPFPAMSFQVSKTVRAGLSSEIDRTGPSAAPFIAVSTMAPLVSPAFEQPQDRQST